MDLSFTQPLSYEVELRPKPEKKSRGYRPLPKDIVRPSARTMEPVYDSGEYLYRIAPFSFPKDEHLGRTMLCVSYLYYAIAKYDKETGRFMGHEYAHTDKQIVQREFEKACKGWVKLDDPYILYDLRISHGYLY